MTDASPNQVRPSTLHGVLVLSITSPKLDDYRQCRDLGQELVAAYRGGDCAHAVVDLAAVQYVSSVGFMPLLSLNRAVREAGGQLVLCNFSDFVGEVFRATNLLINPNSPHAPFDEQPTLEEAIQRLAKS